MRFVELFLETENCGEKAWTYLNALSDFKVLATYPSFG